MLRGQEHWRIGKAFQPGSTSLRILLRHKIQQAQPLKEVKWPKSNLWGLVRNNKRCPGSKTWGLINKAWQKILPALREAPPNSAAAARKIPLWWSTTFKGESAGLSEVEAQNLFSKGLRTIGDLWDANAQNFKSLEHIRQEYQPNGMELIGLATMIGLCRDPSPPGHGCG